MFSFGGSLLVGLGLVWVGFVLYFIPAWVAHRRGHPNANAITLLNVFAGWTFVGWVVALVWAATRVAVGGRSRPVFTTSAVAWAVVVPILLVLGGAFLPARPVGDPEPSYRTRRAARIEEWSRDSDVVADLVRRGVVTEAGATTDGAYLVVGERFSDLAADDRAEVVAKVGREARRRARATALVIYGPDGKDLLATWNPWAGYQPAK